MSRKIINRACSNCAGDYENPDLTAPTPEEGDVENSSQDGTPGPALPIADVVESTGDRTDPDAPRTLSDARGPLRAT